MKKNEDCEWTLNWKTVLLNRLKCTNDSIVNAPIRLWIFISIYFRIVLNMPSHTCTGKKGEKLKSMPQTAEPSNCVRVPYSILSTPQSKKQCRPLIFPKHLATRLRQDGGRGIGIFLWTWFFKLYAVAGRKRAPDHLVSCSSPSTLHFLIDDTHKNIVRGRKKWP